MDYWSNSAGRQNPAPSISVQLPGNISSPAVMSTADSELDTATASMPERQEGWFSPFSLVNRARAAFTGSTTSPPEPVARRRSWRALSASILLQDGQEILLDVTDYTKVQDVKHWCTAKTGVPIARQRLVIHEVGVAEDYSFASLTRSLSVQALCNRRMVAEWASYFLLPQAFSRELSGSGIINWTYRKLLLCLKSLRGEGDNTLVYVQDARGNHYVLEVGCEVSMNQLSSAVEREAGISGARQRITIYEMKPGWHVGELILQLVIRQALLNLSLAQAWLSLAKYCISIPFSRGKSTVPTLEMKVVLGGRETTLNVPTDMTVKQLVEVMQRRERQFVVTRIC